jgi:pyruvate formate lyase activating enzyme
MRVAAIQGSTMLDYPGHLACILFTQGCPYDCFYCHNRSLIPPSGGSGVDWQSFLITRQGLLESVVVSGGEPTVHSALPSALSWMHSLGYLVKVDTNGCNPSMIEILLEKNLAHYIALDVKALPAEYQRVCGRNAHWEAVFATLTLLKKSTIEWEVRTTVYPDLNEEALDQIADLIGLVPRWRLNPYRIPRSFSEKDRGWIHRPAMDEGRIQQWIKSRHHSYITT